jgi:hypothetical protein
LGYISDLSMIQSQADAKRQFQDLKGDRLHSIFKVVLATFVEAQKEGTLDDILLTLGKHTKGVNLKPVFCFVVCDMQGGGKIMCMSTSYSNTMKYMCRKCNINGCNAGGPFIKFQRMSMIKIMELVHQNQHNILKGINQYNVHSAWFHVDKCGCQFGIFSVTTPVEPLDALANGLISDCIHVIV